MGFMVKFIPRRDRFLTSLTPLLFFSLLSSPLSPRSRIRSPITPLHSTPPPPPPVSPFCLCSFVSLLPALCCSQPSNINKTICFCKLTMPKRLLEAVRVWIVPLTPSPHTCFIKFQLKHVWQVCRRNQGTATSAPPNLLYAAATLSSTCDVWQVKHRNQGTPSKNQGSDEGRDGGNDGRVNDVRHEARRNGRASGDDWTGCDKTMSSPPLIIFS